jgi:hypothetical protein
MEKLGLKNDDRTEKREIILKRKRSFFFMTHWV